jgi:branched-chain amino acid transport system ATP-binding protein
MAVILSTQALAKRFGGVVATDNVTLDIMSGELRCIIGPNGAGKSTLFALLCGIHRPDSGAVILKGQDVTRLPAFRRVRLGLGLTFQTNRAHHHLSVGQNLEIPSHRPAWWPGSAERYAYALETFGLDPMSDIRAGELPHDKLQWYFEIAMVCRGAGHTAARRADCRIVAGRDPQNCAGLASSQ